MSNKNEKVSVKKLILFVLCIGALIGFLSSYTTAVIVEKTAGKEFCAQCHTMEPMAQAYSMDVHGGNNKQGIVVKCVECHLPHNTLIGYLFEKSKTGIHDVWAELTYDKSKINWEEKRKHRSTFTYDSGCLKCHENLQDATMGSPKAFIAHKDYFLNKTKKCVECHKNVGHQNLGHYLKKASLTFNKEVK